MLDPLRGIHPAICPRAAACAPRRLTGHHEPREVVRGVVAVAALAQAAHFLDVAGVGQVEDGEAILGLLARVDHRVVDALDKTRGPPAPTSCCGEHRIGHEHEADIIDVGQRPGAARSSMPRS